VWDFALSTAAGQMQPVYMQSVLRRFRLRPDPQKSRGMLRGLLQTVFLLGFLSSDRRRCPRSRRERGSLCRRDHHSGDARCDAHETRIRMNRAAR
jgi:hypothetical protein